MLNTNQIIAISGIGTLLITGVAILVTLKGVRDELWLQTFAEYTKRYIDCVRELPAEARDPVSDFKLNDLDTAERHRVLNAARMYINMCSEEHYLHDKRKIDHETWNIWVLGMRDAFRLPWFRAVWSEIRHEYAIYQGFCAFFDDCHRYGEAAAVEHN